MKRNASATWNGGLKDGQGRFSVGSGMIKDMKFGFRTRFEDEPGTNPEELIAAAHASCFSMALSAQLGERGITPQAIETTCAVTLREPDSDQERASHDSQGARRGQGQGRGGGRRRQGWLPDLEGAQAGDLPGPDRRKLDEFLAAGATSAPGRTMIRVP